MATTGSLAKFQVDTGSSTFVDVVAVGSASWSLSRPALETTAIGDTNASFLVGVQTATVSLDLFYDNDEARHKALLDNINGAGSAFICRIVLETGEMLTGSAYVTSWEVTAAAGDVTRATVQLQITGAVTVTTTT